MESYDDYDDYLIVERENEIIELEKDVTEINDIFRDLNNLVHDQNSLLDTIEYNMSSVQTNTENGLEKLQKANKYQKKAHTKSKYLFGITTIIGAIIGGTLAGKLK